MPDAKIGCATERGASDRAKPWHPRPSDQQGAAESHAVEPNSVRAMSQLRRGVQLGQALERDLLDDRAGAGEDRRQRRERDPGRVSGCARS